jgi:2-dehydro-3-deoxyphosphogluconate aldolase/(4S)-4-hydroxy-2-oxoglutarate aldolase
MPAWGRARCGFVIGSIMSNRTTVLAEIESTGIVAILRASSSDVLIDVVGALAEAGVTCIEATMTTPGALDVVREAAAKFGDPCIFGAGTILDAETARAAILAGARFVVAPTLDEATIGLCCRYDVLAMPGCFTPTEMLRAFELGADLVKVFPASALGPGFFKDVRGPLPQIKLVPTGGITPATAADYIKAGATALGMGSALVRKDWIANRDLTSIRKAAEDMLALIRDARGA